MDKYSSKICLPTLLCLDTKSLFSSINNIEVSKYLDVFRGFFQYLSPGRLVSTFHCGNSISQSSETIFDVITTFPFQSIMMCSLVHSIGQAKKNIKNSSNQGPMAILLYLYYWLLHKSQFSSGYLGPRKRGEKYSTYFLGFFYLIWVCMVTTQKFKLCLQTLSRTIFNIRMYLLHFILFVCLFPFTSKVLSQTY